MAASQAVRSLVSSHGTSQSSSASDDAICDAHLHPHCHFAVDVGCLLERVPVSALTQHHSRVCFDHLVSRLHVLSVSHG